MTSSVSNALQQPTKVSLSLKQVLNGFNTRFSGWLVSRKYASSDTSDGLFFAQSTSDVIFKEEERKSENQRVLLDIEKEGVLKREKLKQQQADYIMEAQKSITSQCISLMKERLADQEKVFKSLIGITDSATHLFNIIHSRASTLSRIASIIDNDFPSLSKQIIATVNSADFLRAVGRDYKNIRDTQSALGFIGYDALKIIIPLMYFKSRIRFSNEYSPLMANKYWSYSLSIANTCLYLGKKKGIKNPESLMIAGLIREVGILAVYHQFESCWDDAKQIVMKKLRDSSSKRDKEVYFSCGETKPNGKVIVDSVLKFSDQISLDTVDSLDWGMLIHIKKVLKEDVQNISLKKRTDAGVVLAQSRISARFNLLREQRLLKNSEIKPILKLFAMTSEDMMNIIKMRMAKFDMEILKRD